MLKIPCSEFFTYDFANKKYISIGKGDFSIEFSKTDEKKENPLLIFRNSVLKILFQGIFKAGVTKLETVNKNFKTISVIQKALLINEQTKKLEFKSVKIFHVNDSESKQLIESFANLERDAEKSNKLKEATESAKNSQKQAEELSKEYIDINQVNQKAKPSTSEPASQNAKPESAVNSKKQSEDSKHKIPESTSQNNVTNINKIENTSTPASKHQTENIPEESKLRVSSLNKIQAGSSQALTDREAIVDDSKAVAYESKSVVVVTESTPSAESKKVITVNSQFKSNENSEQINIDACTNQATGSKGLIKVASQAENHLNHVYKENVPVSVEVSGSQSNMPISVGKITNISIQLISSDKSQNKN